MKVHIDIRDNIDPEDAVQRVAHVISQGRISNNEKNYCFLTSWTDNVCVQVNQYRKSDCFVVFKNKTKNK